MLANAKLHTPIRAGKTGKIIMEKYSMSRKVAISLFIMHPFFVTQAEIETEFLPPSQIKPPTSISAAAQEEFNKRIKLQIQNQKREKEQRPDPESVLSIQQIPVRMGNFTSLPNVAEKLLHLPDTAFTTKSPSVNIADISKTALRECELLKSLPIGGELKDSVTGNGKFFYCNSIGVVSLEESLLYSNRHVDTVNTLAVNAKIIIGGIRRGAIVSRIRNESGDDGVTRIQWRSGEKNMVIRAQGFDDKIAQHVEHIVATFPD
ncbi:hypothetical protein [Thauera sp. Sel9]|uniref:hypothetical protein n=1 Tax=Thauera sp. Sel9 TaxID=2974299 RepID=UPI0021E1319F|nr:hypothetical protein [Thauera sp. Sel9]MCV2216387.1 hypothetical protein [Thauera sp. Sel9]